MKSNAAVYTLIILTVHIMEGFVFKGFYPFMDYFSDSYVYLSTAASGAGVALWPVGYSRFLWLVHQVHYSDVFLFWVQYLLLQVSFLWCVRLLLKVLPGVYARYWWVLVVVINPLLLYLSNYVSGDALFTALSFLWFSLLLLVIYRPNMYVLLLHGIVLAIAFTVRYNALYFPLVSVIAFLLSKKGKKYIIAGLLLPLVLIACFVQYTRNQTARLTGASQFSVFGGWQLANNALYAYRHVQVDTALFTRQDTRQFHGWMKGYMKWLLKHKGEKTPLYDGAYYLQSSSSPLKVYAGFMSQAQGYSGLFLYWGKVSPVYADFGSSFIRRYPLSYARWFVLPNTFNMLVPPLEKLEVYNTGRTSAFEVAIRWFHYTGKTIGCAYPKAGGYILCWVPYFFLLVNLFFVIHLAFAWKTMLRLPDKTTKAVCWLVVALWLLNFGFSITASPVVLRYQIFPVLTTAFFLLFRLTPAAAKPPVQATAGRRVLPANYQQEF
jgi:hypothetical protein